MTILRADSFPCDRASNETAGAAMLGEESVAGSIQVYAHGLAFSDECIASSAFHWLSVLAPQAHYLQGDAIRSVPTRAGWGEPNALPTSNDSF
jgi:hypothetical protein